MACPAAARGISSLLRGASVPLLIEEGLSASRQAVSEPSATSNHGDPRVAELLAPARRRFLIDDIIEADPIDREVIAANDALTAETPLKSRTLTLSLSPLLHGFLCSQTGKPSRCCVSLCGVGMNFLLMAGCVFEWGGLVLYP